MRRLVISGRLHKPEIEPTVVIQRSWPACALGVAVVISDRLKLADDTA
jgi:hypothetical protein